MSSETTKVVTCKPFEGDVSPEEAIDFRLVGMETSTPLCVVPWRSAWRAKCLQDIDKELSSFQCHSTILKREWEIEDINNIIKKHFKRVFCTSTGRHIDLSHKAYPDFVRDSVFSSNSRIYDFCLVGWANNPTRNILFQRYGGLPSVISRDSYFYQKLFRNKDYDKQFTEILAQSRFSLCPAGIRPGTRRFWESLKAGAIPILISDEMRLPECWDWNSTIIRIPQWKIERFPHKIESSIILPPGQEEKMRRNCIAAHEFFQNPANLINYINKV